MSARQGPLNGIKVIELAGIGPGPYAGQLLADMGADVIVVDRPGPAMPKAVDGRGKRSIMLDLKKTEAVEALLKMVANADVLIEGLRPGVTERMGIGPDACHAVNPKLIYGRMTGWGQTGPWSKMAGHDINYISMTGVLNSIGKAGEPPVPPLNMVGDFGGGTMFLVTGILAALVERGVTGKGNIVDAAIIDGTHSLMSFVHGMAGLGRWRNERDANLLDGAMPFYRCYATSDGKYMAVGCIEPQFFAAMMERLPIDKDAFGGQHDPSKWYAAASNARRGLRIKNPRRMGGDLRINRCLRHSGSRLCRGCFASCKCRTQGYAAGWPMAAPANRATPCHAIPGFGICDCDLRR